MRRHPLITVAVASSLAVGATPAAAAEPATTIRVGTTTAFSRIEFHGAQPRSIRREGADLVLKFGPGPLGELARLRVDPPKWLKTAEAREAAGGTELRLTLDPGAQARMGRDEGAAFINLSEAPKDAAPAPEPQRVHKADAPDPTPPSGVVKMGVALDGRTLKLSFPWAAPLGAAVFRRGEALWLVFDAKARLDLSDMPHGLPQLDHAEEVLGPSVSALRLTLPDGVMAAADAQAGTWTLSLGPSAPVSGDAVSLDRDASAAAPVLTARMPGATGVFWLDDPAVGDRIAVVTARAPAKGVRVRQAFVDAAVLASVQGLAIEPMADGLAVTTDGDVTRIGRPQGLSLSQAMAASRRDATPADLPHPAAMPGLIDTEAWSQTGGGGFLARYDALAAGASAEAGGGKGARTQARLGLARFLVGSELAYEAIGELNLLARADPALLDDAEFRGLRGAAKAMAGRYKEAAADFSAPSVAVDPASAVWRGYVESKAADWTGARSAFASGRAAAGLFSPKWRARFARAEAEAALQAGDAGAARAALGAAPTEGLDVEETDAARLMLARIDQAEGRSGEALALFDAVQQNPHGALAAPAELQAVRIRLAQHTLAPAAAVQALDGLRYRWRGDSTELLAARTLGEIHLSQGRYREALEALRAAGRQMPDLPEAAQVQADLSTAFRFLFLQGGADGLQPVQAVGLFNDFRELTPVGADGDRMVRMLSRRLVDVDLLDQAAALLQYQVDNRLDGVPKAEVATDLAAVYVMARKPEQALAAINGSRTTLLPAAMNAERRVLEARALTAIGRGDHALELIDGDKSPEAQDVRADAAWVQQAWPTAGAALEAGLGDRWKTATALGGEDERRLLRAGIAYSLAQDDKALKRLRARWGRLAAQARSADAMRVALSSGTGDGFAAGDLAKAGSQADAFAGWVGQMKSRFMTQPIDGPPPTPAKPQKG